MQRSLLNKKLIYAVFLQEPASILKLKHVLTTIVKKKLGQTQNSAYSKKIKSFTCRYGM